MSFLCRAWEHKEKPSVLGSNATGLICHGEMWMLSEISAQREQSEASLGRPQKEPQRNHREKNKEERDREAGEGRWQCGEAVRELCCSDMP